MKTHTFSLAILILSMTTVRSVWATVIDLPVFPPEGRDEIMCTEDDETPDEAVDDWQFTYREDFAEGGGVFRTMSLSTVSPQSGNFATATVGVSTGGAKDIITFRDNIENDYLPLPTSVTYEGLFYDYFFDTGLGQPCTQMFCPSYSSALSKDPFSGEGEYFLSVGLNSGIRESDFSRRKLNLVIVLDISGSMRGPFDRYYYDRRQPLVVRSEGDEQEEEWNKMKMEVANRAVVALVDHLNPEDSLGVVLFDHNSYVAKPLRKVGKTDIAAIKDHILKVSPMGGTDMSAGMRLASEVFEKCVVSEDEVEIENRIIFLTDAQPNDGDLTEEGMLGTVERLAQKKIYTTFIGIGVDFNTDLIEAISKTRGANYHAVHSPEDFKRRMDENFDYMVTPLAFNLKLTMDSPNFEIQKVYGSPDADESTSEIMKVSTLFPSAKDDEARTRGGLVLLHMKKLSGDEKNGQPFRLKVSYEDRDGHEKDHWVDFNFSESESSDSASMQEYYDNTGIRKGIVLSRYASLLKDWMTYERVRSEDNDDDFIILPYGDDVVRGYNSHGVLVCPEPPTLCFPFPFPPFEPDVLSRWERQSTPLVISKEYLKIIQIFSSYFEREMQAIGDTSMERELELMDLIMAAPLAPTPTPILRPLAAPQ